MTDPRISVIDDDFHSAVVDGPTLHTAAGTWALVGSQGTPSISVRNTEAHAPGIVRITTDNANSGDDAELVFGGSLEQVCMMNEALSFEARFRVSHTTTYAFSLGLYTGDFFANSGEAACVEGPATGMIRRLGRNASTVEHTTSLVAIVAGAWYRVRLEMPNGLRIMRIFDTDGDQLFADSSAADGLAGIPGGATATPVYMSCGIKTLASSAARYLELDRVTLKMRQNRYK